MDGMKKVDSSMLALRESARQAPVVIEPLNNVLETLGAIRKAVGVDAPQQLINLKAEPAAMASTTTAPAGSAYAAAPAPASSPVVGIPAPAAAPATPSGGGLPKAEVDAILASVPAPQKPLAVMLPLSDLPPGWVLSKIPGKTPASYVETFNADNLYEKMDGRA
jgi:hypothetical protein